VLKRFRDSCRKPLPHGHGSETGALISEDLLSRAREQAAASIGFLISRWAGGKHIWPRQGRDLNYISYRFVESKGQIGFAFVRL